VGIFEVDLKRKRASELAHMTTAPEFWNDQEKAQNTLKEQAKLRSVVDRIDAIGRAIEDGRVLLELAEEAADEGTAKEAEVEVGRIEGLIAAVEFERMLSSPYDHNSAILEINAGAGGTDAQDWAEMLMRMYLRWAARRGFKSEVLDVQPAEEAGIKSASILIEGEWAYGLMRAENGVHRLVRISPFDANARRQTAFAAVHAMPELEEDNTIEIDTDLLRVDVYRSSGAGGQHVNKTESAVRLTYSYESPTTPGVIVPVVVQCQNERSQHKNKSTCMKMLRARLFEIKQRENDAKIQGIQGDKKTIEWGSQIRSYVLAPYRMVSDHRTDLKVGNVDAVLDGDIDEFIKTALLSMQAPVTKPAQ
jgi:peptide chain release factor 2